MSGLMWLGAFLLALPILTPFVVIVRIDGWRTALTVYGITAAILAPLVAGAVLLTSAT